jgi:hypothetical protein
MGGGKLGAIQDAPDEFEQRRNASRLPYLA